MYLTEAKIKNAKPKANGKLNKLKDGNGLYCIVNKTSKTWVYRYTRPNGKETTATFGKYPELKLQGARERRIEARQLINSGIDPNKHYKEQKYPFSSSKTQTFTEVFYQWFELSKDNWKPSYQNDIVSRCERHIFPHIGDIPIGDITIQDMIKAFQVINNAGTIDTLGKVKGCSSRVFRYAVGMALISFDPTRDISPDLFKKKKVKHLAHISNPKEIGGLMRILDEYKGGYQVKYALQIAPHIFLRPSELAALQWDEIDFNDNIIRIKPERMKMGDTHLVPLSSQVSLILHKLLSIKVNSKFVFPSPNGADRHISPESLRAGLRRMGLTKDEITTHGFRHMASTRLNELGYRSEVIEIQLAHKERNSVKAAYNHAEYLSDRREMMQFWSNYLDELKNTLINIT